MRQQMALGDFVFSITHRSAYEQLQYKSSVKWVNTEVVNGKPLSHFSAPNLDTISVNGKVFGVTGEDNLLRLRQMQLAGQPYFLVDGRGTNLGQWKILEVTETHKRILPTGEPQVIEFTLSLEEYANARHDPGR
ncbi:phage tail protein [Spartinivicinus ruber]|uniref:phage tail protein n=1 Tax=Spartinivicinus ruber TaxID=2683272 RepID=UPI0013D5F7C5|nr:phage tail protein [Spartinivicinus ruber]